MDKKRWGIYCNNCILFSYKRKGNPNIHDNMDLPVEYYATWNRPDIKTHII